LQSKSNKKAKKSDDKKAGKTKRTSFVDDLSFFTPIKDLQPIEDYGEAWGVHEIFREYNCGVQTERDATTIHFEKSQIQKIVSDFSNLKEDALQEKYQTRESRDWQLKKAKSDIEKHKDQNLFRQIFYRPFDVRWTFYTGTSRGFMGTPRKSIMLNFFAEENLGLIFVRSDIKQLGTYFSISNLITERHFLDSAADSMRIAPLYLKTASNQQNQTQNSNLASDLFSAKASETKNLNAAKTENFTAEFREFVNKKYGQKISPEAILGYIYAVLQSSNYRAKYLEFLKIDFPRVPFVDDVEIFKKLSDLGSELIEVHLLKKTPQSSIGNAKTTDKNFDYICQKPIFKTQTSQLFFNKTSYFENVSEQIFEFKIGGYQVLDKFLNERKGRNLSFDEINHLTKTIKALEFTILQMAKISEIF
jgi:predicted helicase